MIFLIDDDDIQNLINTKVISLVEPNIEVRSFNSAEKGLVTLREIDVKPSLIFLDINMPKMNGWDFLDAYASGETETPVYMLSSSINNMDISKSETYDIVQGFISKPLVKERLEKILTERGLIKP